MSNIEKDILLAKRIAKLVNDEGGKAYYVGGYVRDKILDRENKDIDIEIHGISVETLENILDQGGERIHFGESFGIYNIKGSSLDIALPRKEKLIGDKHTDFIIDVDPYIGTYLAAMRRDFTINSLMEDILTGEIVDHFGGQSDLNNKIIKHIDDNKFKEDTLRVLRAAQFSARFGFSIDSNTISLCKDMEITNLPKERILEELKKALLKSPKPSLFFESLRQMNKLDYWFKEIEELINVKQNNIYHKEGDVWNHTMMVLDEGVKYREKVNNPFGFMLSCLTHDFGKTVCTEMNNGVIISYKHDIVGVEITETFIRRISNENNLRDYVLPLVENHMKPNMLCAAQSSIKSTNKMFDSVSDPLALIYLSICDDKGRITADFIEESNNVAFLHERLDIYNEYMSRPFVRGEDLIKSGFHPGVEFKEMLKLAHKLRLAGIDKDSALRQVIGYGNKLYKK